MNYLLHAIQQAVFFPGKINGGCFICDFRLKSKVLFFTHSLIESHKRPFEINLTIKYVESVSADKTSKVTFSFYELFRQDYYTIIIQYD